jgi:hypothetical protein
MMKNNKRRIPHMKRTLFAKLSLLVTCSLLFTACSGASASGEEDSAPETETASSADTAVQTETEPAAQPADQNLLFEDDFDGTELDTSKWELCPEWKRQGELDIWEHDMTSLDGEGHLVLRAEWDDQKSRVKSGAIRTYELFTAGYGYYEASIKFPIAPGTWTCMYSSSSSVSMTFPLTVPSGCTVMTARNFPSMNARSSTYSSSAFRNPYAVRACSEGRRCENKSVSRDINTSFCIDRYMSIVYLGKQVMV